MPADPGIYRYPDHVLLASVIGSKLVEWMLCRLPPFLVLVVIEINVQAVGGFSAPPLLEPLQDPGWRERRVADGK